MPKEQLADSNNLNVERFRILIIGNANAGKTTILKKACNAKGREPVYLNSDSKLEPSLSRGEHNIEHQFQYPTAHGFVFHDSRGFEAGDSDELKKVKDFIENRAKSKQLKDQLHVIWYCLPTSGDRGMTKAEMSLFESGTGNVPVIAIFTKMDALDVEAHNQLMLDDNVLLANIKYEVPIRAKAIFEKNYLQRLDSEEVKHKPRYVVQLRDMHKEGTDCKELIVRTSQALNGDTLRLFCLSMLRNDVKSRMKQVVNEIIIPQVQAVLKSRKFPEKQSKSLFCKVMRCFPHMLPSFNKSIMNMDKNAVDATKESVFDDLYDLNPNLFSQLFLQDDDDSVRRTRFLHIQQQDFDNDNNHLNNCFIAISLHLQSKVNFSSPQYEVVWLGIATMVIIHYCLFTAQSAADFPKAVNSYMAILTETLVNDIKKACQRLTFIIKEDNDMLFNILMKNIH